MSGRPKASVLPEPVRALPQTSRPFSASGMVSDWIGVGSVIPPRRSTSTRSFPMPSSRKGRAAGVGRGASGDVPPRSSAAVVGVRRVIRKMDSVSVDERGEAECEPPQITATRSSPEEVPRHATACSASSVPHQHAWRRGHAIDGRQGPAPATLGKPRYTRVKNLTEWRKSPSSPVSSLPLTEM